jgi:hypothetical protein
LATSSVCDELREYLNEYLALVVTIRASGRTDQGWMEFRKQALRPQISANTMLDKLDQLDQHRAISSGWLSLPTAVIAVAAIILLPILFSGSRFWLFMLIIAIVAWRLLPDYSMMKSIQKLGENF